MAVNSRKLLVLNSTAETSHQGGKKSCFKYDARISENTKFFLLMFIRIPLKLGYLKCR